MNDKQEVPTTEVTEFGEIRELNEAEVLAVAGGPQVLNDGVG